MSHKVTVGWDLGGAHIKAVLLDQNASLCEAIQISCPLWKGLTYLETGLDELLRIFDRPISQHAIAMTGELVDLFANRAEGVARIVETVKTKLSTSELLFFAGSAGFMDASNAITHANLVASANWYATASFVAEKLEQGLLVDIGSTTSDIIPFCEGKVQARAYTDHERLITDELVYSGVIRTPLMAFAQRVPFAGQSVGLMAEHFATTADVYRLTGALPDGADQAPTADDYPKSIPDSARRLARMLGQDFASDALSTWVQVANWFSGQQFDRLNAACQRSIYRALLNPAAPIVGAGVGCFVAQRIANSMGRRYIAFSDLVESSDQLKSQVSTCAPAYAVAALAQARDRL